MNACTLGLPFETYTSPSVALYMPHSEPMYTFAMFTRVFSMTTRKQMGFSHRLIAK